jgi:dolichol-phosphate mannosyltransferase
MGTSIIVPCHNEAANIPHVVPYLVQAIVPLTRSGTVELLFVDDGSTDGTAAAIDAAYARLEPTPVEVRVEHHPVNRGLGAALCTGFQAATGHVLVTTDCDGTYDFAEIPALVSALEGADVVTASPYHPLGGTRGVPSYRLLASRACSLVYRCLLDRRVHTYTSLFRAYRREVVERIALEHSGPLAVAELLVKAMLLGHRVAEYPTVLHARLRGASKARLLRDLRAHVGFQGRVMLHRIGAVRLVDDTSGAPTAVPQRATERP